MTKIVEGFRLAGDIVMVLGAWFHRASLIVAGLVVILIAWSSGGIRKGLWRVARGFHSE